MGGKCQGDQSGPLRRVIGAGLAAIALVAGSLIATSPAMAQAQAAPLPLGKLTDMAVPVVYRLDLTVDPRQKRFSGRVEIDATLKQPSGRVILHGRDLAMRRAVAIAGGRTYPGNWSQVEPTGIAVLSFAQPLPAGPVTFAFEYDAGFSEGPSGMFRVKVGNDWYGWSQFESTDARAAFPAFDDPGFKTPFSVTLRTPPGLVAVSNAPEASKALEGGMEVHRFIPTLPLPSYLVAMMVGPFAVAEGAVPPTPQRARPLPLRIVSTRQNADKLSFALEGSKQIVALLEDYFGDAFPYPKLDQVTTPILPGAMENAGADLYRDELLVLDGQAPVPQQRRFGMVVAHELSHQWFGDLVTPAWWDDIWLNESFANWMGYRIGDAWRPRLNIRAGALAEGFAAMGTDALAAGRPIRQEIATNAQINGAFDAITYGKGGHVVAMIAGFMGETKFRDGVRRYMGQHRYGNATSTDFFAAMAEAAGDPRIVPAMRGFTDQQGVPLLTFDGRGGRYSVTQSRYARLGATPPGTQWRVPLCVRRGKASHCELMEGRGMELAIGGGGPLIPNAGGTGYYRFELPRRDWDALVRRSGSLPGGEAQALADSLLASFQAGRASSGQIAELARRVVNHPDSYASAAAGDGLAWLASAGLIDDAAMPAYRAFVDRLYAPLLARYGFDPRTGAYAGEDPERAQRRAQLVGRLSARDAALGLQLGNAAKAWLGGDAAALDPAWYGDAFGVHVTKGGIDAAKALVERALASQDPVFRPAALAAAAGSGKEDIARWLIEELKDERLRPVEQRALLRDILQVGGTRELGYKWLRENLDAMLEGGGIFFAARLPQLLNGFCSVDRADEIARDLRPRLAGKPAELELERTIERVRSCGLLKDARRDEVSREIAKLR